MRSTSTKSVTVGLALLLAGCAPGPFDGYQAMLQIQGEPFQLDGEQITLTLDQITCAEKADLLVVVPAGGRRSTGQLKNGARALGFSDDVHIGDPDYNTPYVQVRGKFPLVATNIALNDIDQSTKMAEAGINVTVDHKCFQRPAPRLMGVYKGRFSTDAKPTFEFRGQGEVWRLTGLVH